MREDPAISTYNLAHLASDLSIQSRDVSEVLHNTGEAYFKRTGRHLPFGLSTENAVAHDINENCGQPIISCQIEVGGVTYKVFRDVLGKVCAIPRSGGDVIYLDSPETALKILRQAQRKSRRGLEHFADLE